MPHAVGCRRSSACLEQPEQNCVRVSGIRGYLLHTFVADCVNPLLGHYECASVISSYISFDDVDRIVHPLGAKSDVLYPEDFARFIHGLTRTHEVHPVRIVLDVAKQPHVVEHRKKLLWTVDRLFEGQLRSKEPNEVGRQERVSARMICVNLANVTEALAHFARPSRTAAVHRREVRQ